jgi:hypothetical protein
MCFLSSKLRWSNAHHFAEGPGEIRLRREASGEGDLVNLAVFTVQAHFCKRKALMADKLVRCTPRGEPETACKVGRLMQATDAIWVTVSSAARLLRINSTTRQPTRVQRLVCAARRLLPNVGRRLNS